MINKEIIRLASNTVNVGLKNKFSHKVTLKNTICGDRITLESGNDTTGSTALFLDRGENNFTLSAINETSGSDAGIQVEVVSQVSSM